MRRLRALTCVGLALFVALTLTAQTSPQEQSSHKARPHYSVQDLGTLGGTSAFALGINNKRQISGFANLAGDQDHHAFVWMNGTMTDLGSLGGPNSLAVKINEGGAIAGHSETSTPDPFGGLSCPFVSRLGFTCDAVGWRKGNMYPLPTIGGNNAWGLGINDRFQVTGAAENLTRDSTCEQPVYEMKPVIWTDGNVLELPTFPGDPDGGVTAINNRGQAVGFTGGDCPFLSNTHFLRHVVLWHRGVLTDLGNLGSSVYNNPNAINDRGQVVGQSTLADNTTIHAFLWEKGVMKDIGDLPGELTNSAIGINEHSEVVGQSCDVNSNCRAVIWREGTMTDLNTLIPADSALYLLSAQDLNDRGDIVGYALERNIFQIRAFLLTPEHGKAEWLAAQPNARIVLPENVRELLKQPLAIRFGISLTKPQ